MVSCRLAASEGRTDGRSDYGRGDVNVLQMSEVDNDNDNNGLGRVNKRDTVTQIDGFAQTFSLSQSFIVRSYGLSTSTVLTMPAAYLQHFCLYRHSVL